MQAGRPSHATVVAYLALFVALAGTAVAASNKIDTKNIKKQAVTTKKIADGAVTTPKLANFAVNSTKLANEAVTEAQLAPDSVSGNKLQQASIGTGKLRQNAVENEKIADNAVTGPKVADGSLGLVDVAQVVASASFDPPNLASGACATSSDIFVAGLQGGDELLVLPGGISDGWAVDFLLDGYGMSGDEVFRVSVCNVGTGADDAGPLPLLVLGFR